MTPDTSHDLPTRVRLLLLEVVELEQWAQDARAAVGGLVLTVPLEHRRQLAEAAGCDLRLLELCASMAVARQARLHNPADEGQQAPRRH